MEQLSVQLHSKKNTNEHLERINNMFSKRYISPSLPQINANDIPAQRELAKSAAAEGNSAVVIESCNNIIAVNSDDADAWQLLAKFDGWNSKTYQLDQTRAFQAILRASGLSSEKDKYAIATEIYSERKKQIAFLLESELSMPSHTSVKRLQETMMLWKELLVRIPNLNADLLEDEINLVANLCMRSRMGIMPNDRMIRTAYKTFNNKESYDDTFRKALSPRIESEEEKKIATCNRILVEADNRQAMYNAWSNTMNPSCEEIIERLREERIFLSTGIEELESMTNKLLYVRQIQELERQLSNTKPYKLMQRNEIQTQIDALRTEIKKVEKRMEPISAPLQAKIDNIDTKLKKLSAEG